MNKIIRNLPWVILVLVFFGIVFKFMPRQFCDLGGDSAQYIILAEGISSGRGLHMVNYPGEPLSFYYPPLFSFLLSPLIYFWGRNFYLMHILTAVLGWFSLLFFYKVFRAYSDRTTALFSVLFLGVNWAFVLYTSAYILSDIPYLFFSGLTLYIFLNRFKNKQGKGALVYFLFILSLVLSYFTRYSATVLFLALIVSLLFSRKKEGPGRILLAAGIFITVFLGWNAASYFFPSGLPSHLQFLFMVDPYAPYKGSVFTDPFQHIFLRFISGAGRVSSLFGPGTFFYFLKAHFLNGWPSFIVLVLVFMGLWRKFRQDNSSLLHFYFIFYLFLMFFWLFGDFMEGIRYLLPVMPLVFFYFTCGMKNLFKVFPLKIGRFLFYGTACFLLILSVINLSAVFKTIPQTLEDLPVPLKNFVSMQEWIKVNTEEDAVVLSRKPSITYFYSGRKSVVYPYVPDTGEIWQKIMREKVKYVIIDEFSTQTYYYLLPFMYAYNDKFELVYRLGNTGLFKLKAQNG